jgi:uncharacterized protein YndB with AHSA1/START domain
MLKLKLKLKQRRRREGVPVSAKPNEIQLIRVYSAPVKLVWEAWTDLKQIAKWWGPRGFSLTTQSKDLRPGGKWIYTMHGPDGTDYPNIATYHEVVKYEKLVYDHGGNDEREKLFTVTVTFKEEKGKTTLCITSALPTAEAATAMKQFIKAASGNSTWDRLDEYLEGEATGKDVFVIHRSFRASIKSSFRASIKTVFEMWVNPEQLSRWLAPTGSTMAFIRTDVREGGSSQWSMTAGNGQTTYGKVLYKRISPHSLLVYSQQFCDPAGNPSKPPFAPTYPDQVLTTVTLVEEGANETRVTVRWEILGEATEAERRTFHEMKSGMTGGWNGSFDKLDSLLER